MAAVTQVELEVAAARDLAMIAKDDSVWIVVPLRWWDLATIVWWLFIPHDRKATVGLTISDGLGSKKMRFRAVRVASRHVRVRGLVS